MWSHGKGLAPTDNHEVFKTIASISEVFGRINSEGNVDILYADSGESVTRLDADVFPVGSGLRTL